MTVAVRTDHGAAEVRALAKAAVTPEQARRLLAIALVLEGASRAEAARSTGMDRQTLRDWVHRFNAAGPDGSGRPQGAGPAAAAGPGAAARAGALPGERPRAGAGRRGALAFGRSLRLWSSAASASATRSAAWASWCGRSASAGSRRGRSTPSPIPRRKPSSKKTCRPDRRRRRRQGAGRRLEIWFQDESRIGQKGELTRQWARRGSRPRQPKDQRHTAAYIFAAVCPASERTAALVLPYVDTAAMNLHLAEISAQVAADAHAVVILDQAGWHGARALRVPDNISLLPLPPYSPELNPVENLWQFLKHNFLNARIFDSLRRHRRRLLRRLEPPPRHPRPDPIHHHPRLGQSGQSLGRLV